MSDPTETPGFNLEMTDDWIPALLEAAERRARRGVAAAGIRGWLGGLATSPDHNAIIGEAEERLLRFLYATGFSGHGFSCRAWPRARSCATSSCAASPSSTSRRSASTASTAATCAPSSTSLMLVLSNVDVAADAVRDAIVRGRFKPGERIKEIPLAAEVGTPRGPIRDALRRVERDGIVEVIPNRGAVVPEIRAVDVLEIYALARRAARSRCTS